MSIKNYFFSKQFLVKMYVYLIVKILILSLFMSGKYKTFKIHFVKYYLPKENEFYLQINFL